MEITENYFEKLINGLNLVKLSELNELSLDFLKFYLIYKSIEEIDNKDLLNIFLNILINNQIELYYYFIDLIEIKCYKHVASIFSCVIISNNYNIVEDLINRYKKLNINIKYLDVIGSIMNDVIIYRNPLIFDLCINNEMFPKSTNFPPYHNLCENLIINDNQDYNNVCYIFNRLNELNYDPISRNIKYNNKNPLELLVKNDMNQYNYDFLKYYINNINIHLDLKTNINILYHLYLNEKNRNYIRLYIKDFNLDKNELLSYLNNNIIYDDNIVEFISYLKR